MKLAGRDAKPLFFTCAVGQGGQLRSAALNCGPAFGKSPRMTRRARGATVSSNRENSRVKAQ